MRAESVGWLLAEDLSERLPEGAKAFVVTDEDGCDVCHVLVAVRCRLPRLRFWRRAAVRRWLVERTRRRAVSVLPADIAVVVKWATKEER